MNIILQKGDHLYLYTDGFADKFSGPKGKKFKYKALNNLLLQNSKIGINEQLQVFNTTILDWKGELEQVDDICLIGIKF